MPRLFNKNEFKDNCGFGLIANINGIQSESILTKSIDALVSMTHRGGVGADGKTGDGCGLLFDINKEYFKNFDEVSILEQPTNSNSNYWLNNIVLERFKGKICEEIIQELNFMGINARPIWTPMHYLDIYKNSPRTSLPVTESIVNKIISLPSSPYLSEYF